MLPTVFLGLLFGYLVWKSGSILCGIVAHALNNGIMATLVHAPDVPKQLGIANADLLCTHVVVGADGARSGSVDRVANATGAGS